MPVGWDMVELLKLQNCSIVFLVGTAIVNYLLVLVSSVFLVD